MCDTLVCLTDDGVLFAKNSDRHPNEAQHLRWFAAADHVAGSELETTWTRIPQVARTHAVLLSQPWWMWGAEIGANEHGVVIGNEAVFTHVPPGPPSLLGMDLLRLALERAATAAEAVGVIIELLEAHGQGGSCSHAMPSFTYDNSFLVADPNGAIVVETAGRAWATEVVTGRGRSISNGLTIEPFASAHANAVRGRLNSCVLRRTRTEATAAAALGPADLFAGLRDHGSTPPGTAPRYWSVNGAIDGPCAHAGGVVTSMQTTASWVADLRGPILHWATGTAAPCTSTFKPVRVDQPVDLGPLGNERFDPAVGWWRHELLHRMALRDQGASHAALGAERDELERTWLADPPDTASTFALATDAETRWLRRLAEASGPDHRPAWLRAIWDRLDADAEMALLVGRSPALSA